MRVNHMMIEATLQAAALSKSIRCFAPLDRHDPRWCSYQDSNLNQVALHFLGKGRLFSLLGMIAYLGLAICVFTWGLQYKLSLYVPPHASSHQIPHAKLLSKNEQTETKECPLLVRTKTSTKVSYTVFPAILLVLLLVLNILSPQAS